MRIRVKVGSGGDAQLNGAITDILAAVRACSDKGRDRAAAFEELPPQKDLPDYYDIIKEPMALDMIETKRSENEYTSITPFLKDLGRIFWNARHYNMPGSLIVKDVKAIEDAVNKALVELKARGWVDVSQLPEIGPPEEARAGEGARVVEEETSAAIPAKREAPSDDDEGSGDPARNKRGKSLELRAKQILRDIRKFESKGRQLARVFEELPDRKDYPDYYDIIKLPMSLETVSRKLKSKAYTDLAAFAADLRQVFHNAHIYNEDTSQIHKDATMLLKALDEMLGDEVEADAETSEEPVADKVEGQVPLEQVTITGEVYKIGDWVYLKNPNDSRKPIIAQIFRIWEPSSSSGAALGSASPRKPMIHTCWYYRPEQTVHRADRPWVHKEIVKTAQYRDHAADEIVGRCYVMHATRYVRGRPVAWHGEEKDLWVCESRYVEETRQFIKIKSWRSCVPEERREECATYEVKLFEYMFEPRRIPSPLMYLMPKDKAKWIERPEEPTPMPEEPGSPSGPPKVGNIIITAIIEVPQPPKSDAPTLPRITERTSSNANIVLAPAPGPNVPMPQVLNPIDFPTATAVKVPPPSHTTPIMPGRTPTFAVGVAGQGMSGSPMAGGGTPRGGEFVNTFAASSPSVSMGGVPPSSGISTSTGGGGGGGKPTLASASANSLLRGTTGFHHLPPVPQPPQSINRLYSLGSRVHAPAYAFPIGALGLSPSATTHLATDAKHRVLWFPTPPLDPVDPAGWEGMVVGHSAAFLAHKRRQARESSS
ncbi:hypothetical protein PYCC9005_005651 [Savitreella phatthalungensis]